MSLLMDTETNRFWARVDFLATGEIALHIPEECELPIRVLVSRGGRSTEYEPSNSEIPNNCEECKHWNDTEDGCADRHECRATTEDWQDWKDKMWAEAVVTEPTTEDCSTVPTSSKMEQVDEPQTERSE